MNIYSCVDGSNIDKLIILFNSVYINASKKEDIRISSCFPSVISIRDFSASDAVKYSLAINFSKIFFILIIYPILKNFFSVFRQY